MSAIWGKISFTTDKDWATATHNAMQEVYETRCKIDKYSHIIEGSVYMGSGVQFITAEAQSEIVPLFDRERGISFTADCLLDNRAELIRELNEKETVPDGTLIYKSYLKWGKQCASHLKGLFSFAVYEAKEKALYLFSDHTASRCLYYYKDSDSVTFSTLITPIIKDNTSIKPNINYLKDYLTAPGLMPNISGTETPYEGIYKLNPGSYLKVTCDSVTETQYWNPGIDNPGSDCHSPGEYLNRFMEIYGRAVKSALRTNGETGISMSSGFDSASVGVLAASELAKENKTLFSYTYIPTLEANVLCNKTDVTNEQSDVEKIAAMYPNIRPSFLYNEGKHCLRDLQSELNIMEIPFKAIVNMPNLCEIYREAAADGCKVLLTGQCGNSTVSHGYIDDVLFDLYRKKKYLSFIKYLNRYSKAVKESRKAALKGCINYFNFAIEVLDKPEFKYKLSNAFLNKEVLDDYPLKERYTGNGLFVTDSIPTCQEEYQKNFYKAALFTYMGELETKMGLFHGLVIRDATKDKDLLSFCYNLPYNLYAYLGTPRYLIREGFKDKLPEHILNDWMRYSVQNADYLSRIIKDYDAVCTDIIKALENSVYNSWFDIDSIKGFLKTTDSDSLIRDFSSFDSITYLYAFALFTHCGQ